MLKITVEGKGLIPRGLGIAPRRTPFAADLPLIGTIMATPGLKVKYLNPIDNKLKPLTPSSLKAIYKQYGMDDHEASSGIKLAIPDTGNNPDTNPALKDGPKVEFSKGHPPKSDTEKTEASTPSTFSLKVDPVVNEDETTKKTHSLEVAPVINTDLDKSTGTPSMNITPVLNPDEKEEKKEFGTLTPILSDDDKDKKDPPKPNTSDVKNNFNNDKKHSHKH